MIDKGGINSYDHVLLSGLKVKHLHTIHDNNSHSLRKNITITYTEQKHKTALARSLSGNKVGGVGPGVVVDWVGKMVSKVLQRTLSGHNSLDKESKHREHG